MKRVFGPLVVLGCLSICAQDDGRIAYQARQAAQEVQRLSSQFDQLESRVEAISSRMNGMESSNSTRDIRAEVGAIRSELNELKRRQAAMRGEIVAELSKKMADLIAKSAPPPPPPSRPASSSRGDSPQRRRSDTPGDCGAGLHRGRDRYRAASADNGACSAVPQEKNMLHSGRGSGRGTASAEP